MSYLAWNIFILLFIVLLGATVYVGYLTVKYFKGKCEILEEMNEKHEEQEERYIQLCRALEDKVEIAERLLVEKDKLIKLQNDHIRALEVGLSDKS